MSRWSRCVPLTEFSRPHHGRADPGSDHGGRARPPYVTESRSDLDGTRMIRTVSAWRRDLTRGSLRGTLRSQLQGMSVCCRSCTTVRYTTGLRCLTWHEPGVTFSLCTLSVTCRAPLVGPLLLVSEQAPAAAASAPETGPCQLARGPGLVVGTASFDLP
eukprot:766667-Hanusia_phi.AAC.2